MIFALVILLHSGWDSRLIGSKDLGVFPTYKDCEVEREILIAKGNYADDLACVGRMKP